MISNLSANGPVTVIQYNGKSSGGLPQYEIYFDDDDDPNNDDTQFNLTSIGSTSQFKELVDVSGGEMRSVPKVNDELEIHWTIF